MMRLFSKGVYLGPISASGRKHLNPRSKEGRYMATLLMGRFFVAVR